MVAAAPLFSEPKTPLWLTCVGVGLFLLGGLFLVFRMPMQPRPEKPAAATEPSARMPALPASLAGRAAPTNRMDPEAAKRLQDRLRQAPPGAGGAAAPRPPGAAAQPPGGH